MRKLVLLAVLCMVGSSVLAQTKQTAPDTAAGDFLFDSRSHIRLGKGDTTWTLAACLLAPMGGDNNETYVNANGSLGYFLVDQFELEGDAVFTKNGPLQGVSVGAGLNMYFREFFDKLYPYVGLGVSTWLGDLSDQGTHIQAKVGARYYFTDNLGMRLWLEYDRGDSMIYDSTSTVTAYIGIFSMAY